MGDKIPDRFCLQCDVKKARYGDFFCSLECLRQYNKEHGQ